MAGGPIFPSSDPVPDASGQVFPNVHVGTNRRIAGMGIADATTLSADRTWFLNFDFPNPLPSGTCKLRLRGYANATTGDVDFQVFWKSVALTESIDLATGSMFDEGALAAVTFSVAHAAHQLLVTFDADTPVAGETCIVNLVVLDATTTIAAVSTWQASLIWE